MTLWQTSLTYQIWVWLCDVYEDSTLHRFLAAAGRWCSGQVEESRILRPLCREGIVARSWRDSFLCRVLSALVNLPGTLLHAWYKAWNLTFEDSFFARLAFDMGDSASIAQFWCIAALWCIPYERWNNAYSFMTGVLLLLLFYAGAMRTGRRLDVARIGFYPALMLAAVTLAVTFSYAPGLSARFLIYHVSAALLVVITVSAVRNGEDLKRLCAGAAVCVGATGAYGIVQRIQGVKVNPSYVDLKVNAGMPGRVFSIFDNPNTFAQVLLLLLPLVLALFLTAKHWQWKAICAGIFCVGGMAMAMTYSRASWVGLAFAAVVFVVLWNRKLIPFGILAALVVLAILPDTVFNRILTIFNTSDTSTNSRFPLYQAAGEFLQQRPVLGAGLGSDAVRQAIGDLNLFHGKDHFVHCHNIYLQVWCETGLVGVISFVGGILWTFKKGCRAVARATCDPVVRMTILGGAAALMGTMVCGLADYIWNYPRVMLIFWFVCALTLAGIRLAARQDGEETSAPVSE